MAPRRDASPMIPLSWISSITKRSSHEHEDDNFDLPQLVYNYLIRASLKSQLNWFSLATSSCGPPSKPKLFKSFGQKLLGSGSTGVVTEWICCEDVVFSSMKSTCADRAFFQIYAPIRFGESVALKCHAYSNSCIGSLSGGAAPSNYPTKLATGVKERIMGARLAGATGTGKENVGQLLASWFDCFGLWLVFRLVPHAKGLDEILVSGSSSRDAICSRPVSWTAALFQQFASALQLVGRENIVHRDGGLSNWLLSGIENDKPAVTLIDFGLSLCKGQPLTAPDSSEHLLRHLLEYEPFVAAAEDCTTHETMGDMFVSDFNIERLNPIDWCYSPGATGPKFPPPPELRVVRETLPENASDRLKTNVLPYSTGYDVWILGWTFLQIILGERWEDWRSKVPDDPLLELVQSYFFSKDYQAPVPWELGVQPPAWRLSVLAYGADHFQKCFLDEFLLLISNRILARGFDAATPSQAEFLNPDSKLRSVVLRMISYRSATREEYLMSGSLQKDLEELASQ